MFLFGRKAQTQRKSLYLLLIVLFGINIILYYHLLSTPSTGYSIDIFSQIGRGFWSLWLVSVFLSIPSLFVTETTGILKYVRAAVIIQAFLAPILIPVSLGYFLPDRMDSMYYLGISKAIINTGHFPSYIYPYPLYPVLHSVISIVIDETDNIHIVATLTSNTLGVFLSGLIYILLKTISPKGDSRVFLMLSLPYYVGHYYTSLAPNYYAYVLLFIIMILWIRSILHNEVPNHFIHLTLLLAMPFAHPFVSITVIFMMLSLVISFPFFEDYVEKHQEIRKNLRLKSTVQAALLLELLIFTFWAIIVSTGGEFAIKNIIKGVLTSTINPTIERSVQEVSKVRIVYPREILFWIITTQGKWIILTTLTLLGILKKGKLLIKKYPLLIFLSGVSAIIEVTFLILPVLAHHLDRILCLNYAFFGFLIITGLYLGHQNMISKKFKVALVLLLTYSIVFSVTYLYYSPLNYQPYTGIAQNEIVGMSFLDTHYEERYTLFVPGDQLKVRFGHLFYLNDIQKYYNKVKVLWHQYTLEGILDYPGPKYIIINDFYKERYLKIPQYARTHRLSQEKLNWVTITTKYLNYQGLNMVILGD